jgi:hypothetical protein
MLRRHNFTIIRNLICHEVLWPPHKGDHRTLTVLYALNYEHDIWVTLLNLLVTCVTKYCLMKENKLQVLI